MTAPSPVTPDLPLRRWTPVSQLRAARSEVPRPAVRCIDVHNHLGRWLSEGEWMIDDVGSLLAVMDARDVQLIVNLDGRWGEELDENLARYDLAHPGRFATFCQLDWNLLGRPDGGAALLRQLDDSVRRGARGVKVWKNLGLEVVDADGRLVAPDDPRVVAVLQRAGEHGIPVLIHTADPIAFFEPLDERNERLDELGAMPEWWFGDRSRHPDFDTLLAAHARLVTACPGTSFIGAHVGCAAEDLDRVDALLRAAPN